MLPRGGSFSFIPAHAGIRRDTGDMWTRSRDKPAELPRRAIHRGYRALADDHFSARQAVKDCLPPVMSDNLELSREHRRIQPPFLAVNGLAWTYFRSILD